MLREDNDESTPASTTDFDFTTERVLEVEKPPSRVRGAVEWLVVIGGAVVVALLIKTFLLQAFYIPSESMLPTLGVGDRVLVNKLSYKVGDVSRGDLIVFERPEAEQTENIKDLIKRVIALPGESVVIQQGKVFVDGEPLDESYLPSGTVTSAGPLGCTDAAPCIVPDNAVWVMGDNRDQSRDSRWFGAIPENEIVGRAFFRVWPLDRIGFL